jgi:hypothetical protein
LKIYDKNAISRKIELFGRESLRGFLCVNIIALGRRVGIFNYLYKKAQSQVESKRIDNLYFTFEELEDVLGLDIRYLDAWLNAANEIGIFKKDNENMRVFKTEPYIYDFLINEKSPFFLEIYLEV